MQKSDFSSHASNPSNEDAVTVRSISPITIEFPQKTSSSSTRNGEIDHHDMENVWKKLQVLRAYIETLRGNMDQLRDRQSEIQDKQLEADNIYLSLIRRQRVTDEFLNDEIENAFEKLQALRFEYSEVDGQCRELRDPLKAAEHEQMRMEYRFYKNLEKLSNLPPGTIMNWSSSSATSVSSGDYDNRTYHPLWEDYQRKVGAILDLEEDFAELEEFKMRLEDQQQLREGVGMTLQPEDKEFLEGYEAEKAQLLSNLQNARADAEKARVTCIEAGVWRDNSSSDGGSASDDETDIPSELSFSTDLDSKIIGSEHIEEVDYDFTHEETQEQSGIAPSMSPSQILKAIQNNSDVLSNRFVDYIQEKTSTGNYVNLWLLHKLRSSPIAEFGLLRRRAEDCRAQVGDSVWQANIISKWLDDDTSKIPSATITDPDSNSTKAPPGHPFQYWKTKPTVYQPNSTSDAVFGSLLMSFFDPFVHSARIQPKGLLYSTTEPALQQLDVGNFFLHHKKEKEKKEKHGVHEVDELQSGASPLSCTSLELVGTHKVSLGS